MSVIEQTLPAGTWQLDPVHSRAAFAVKHSAIATFRGHFSEVRAELTDASGTPTLTGAAAVSSVEVPVEQLKGHLLTPDFFDAEQHPEITFVTSDVFLDGARLVLKGDLTIKGVTKAVEATGSIAGPAVYLDGNERIAIELSTVVDRTDYGVDWNADLPGGGQAVGNDVTLTVELQLVRPSEA